jgi:hypothetical protein
MERPDPLPTVPYLPRRTQSLGVVEMAGWTVKLIGITAGEDLPNDVEIQAATAIAEAHLPQPARTERRVGVAFVIVHRGAEALWVIVGWWDLDILYHRLFRADLGTVDLRPVPPDGPVACVWELLAIDHERQAWVAHVLRRPADPDLAGYLAASVTVPATTT